MVRKLPAIPRPELVVDQTGVGRAVADIFDGVGLRATKVTITGGDGDWSAGGGEYRVSKLALVSHLEAALHTAELTIAKGVEAAPELRTEQLDFSRKLTPSRNAQFEGRVGAHDDFVLSLAFAAW